MRVDCHLEQTDNYMIRNSFNSGLSVKTDGKLASSSASESLALSDLGLCSVSRAWSGRDTLFTL